MVAWAAYSQVRPTPSIGPFPCPETKFQPCQWLGLLLVRGPLDTSFQFLKFSLHHHCLQPAQGWDPGWSVQGPGWNQRKVSETGKRTEKAELVLGAAPSFTSHLVPQPPAPTFLGGGVPGTVLGSASSSSSEAGARSWEGWETGGREVEGCAREPSLPTVVSMAIM